MNTKNVFKNLAILLVFTIGIFAIYSFTSTNIETSDLTSYDASYYQDIDTKSTASSFTVAIESDEKCVDGKCGDDKKTTDAKAKDTKTEAGKCGDDKKAETETETETKCGEGKCGDDKKTNETKKADEEKDAKCGEGKCG